MPEIVSFLIANTTYRNVLENLDPELIHRETSRSSCSCRSSTTTRSLPLCNLEQRKMLRLYLKRYEVDLINYCLRIVINR